MHFLDTYSYGLWGSVAFNIIFFGLFAFFCFKPATKRDWRTFGAFTAFIVALFSEMFGYPLTIFFLSSILGNKYPVLDPFTHLNGHLWVALSGGSIWVYSVLHPLSNILIFAGLMIISIGWKGIHAGNGTLVTAGIYKFVRHPQYSGFALTIIGFLIQWPTIITMLMAPILLIMYTRLSRKEEKIMIEEFGQEYLDYIEQVPAFIPNRRITLGDFRSFFSVFKRDNHS